MLSNYCIYIPRVNGFYSKDIVEHKMSEYFGTVDYVDTVNIPEPNCSRIVDYDYSAFVYISEFHRSQVTQDILHNYLEQNKPYEFQFSLDDECWILMKNPAHPHSDNVIAQQQYQIKCLESTVNRQSQEINRIQNTIYQILGHVYDNQSNSEQSEMIGLYNAMMHGKQIMNRWMLDEHDDGTEEYARSFMEDSDSDSESEQKTGKSSPMMDMDASASIPVTDRLKNTAELCGNN